jgi:hypothetical protein
VPRLSMQRAATPQPPRAPLAVCDVQGPGVRTPGPSCHSARLTRLIFELTEPTRPFQVDEDEPPKGAGLRFTHLIVRGNRGQGTGFILRGRAKPSPQGEATLVTNKTCSDRRAATRAERLQYQSRRFDRLFGLALRH